MQGSKCLAFFAIISILTISACSSNHRKGDCHECLDEPQAWNKFSWENLKGTWRGSLEVVTNDIHAKKKERAEKSVELSFVAGTDFLKQKNIASCAKFPENSVVLVGQVWDAGKGAEHVYEVFGEREDNTVSYGRAVVTGAKCNYVSLGRSVGKNRLDLPAVDFTQRKTKNRRVLASGATPETEVNFEFLNFESERTQKVAFINGSRMPASVQDQDKPPLMFRVFQMSRLVETPFARGKWQRTDEHLYRLWKVK
jgi:hypothetical protein